VTGWEKADVILSGLAALGAVLGVGVLVWIQVLRPRWQAPVLHLQDTPEMTVYPVSDGVPFAMGKPRPLKENWLMVRLLVENERRKERADDACAYLLGVRAGDALGTTWRLHAPIQWMNQPAGENNGVTVHAGHPLPIDLLHISSVYPERLYLKLNPVPVGYEYLTVTDGCREWTLYIVLVAKGAEPQHYRVNVAYSGGWRGEKADADIRFEVSRFRKVAGFRARFSLVLAPLSGSRGTGPSVASCRSLRVVGSS
jgi:hypothetical protein